MYRAKQNLNALRHQGATQPVNPQTQRLRACLRDTLENLLVSIFGDEEERDGAVEDVASVEICLHELSLERKLTSLPFTFTPQISMSKIILGLRPEDYQKTDPYRDPIRRLFYMLHVEWHCARYLGLAQSILDSGDQRCAQAAVMYGEYSLDVRMILNEATPEHRQLLEQHDSLRDGDQMAVKHYIRHLLLRQRQAFWTDIVDGMDDVTAENSFVRLTRGESSGKTAGPLDDLLSTIDVTSLDGLLVMGALRRRLLGPAKHWLHDAAAGKPYLEYVVHEAVDFAVQTLHSPEPRTNEAVDAIKYAFSQITRSLIRLIQVRSPEFIEQAPWKEQCRTVVRTAGLTTAHADVLAAALEEPWHFNREDMARSFGAQWIVPALSVLVMRRLSIDDARTFLQQTVLAGVVPARPDVLHKAIKANLAPHWPRSLQLGLLMRLNLPPREASMATAARGMSTWQPARPGPIEGRAAAARTTAAIPAAPNVRTPAAIGRRPPRRPSRACEMCLTM